MGKTKKIGMTIFNWTLVLAAYGYLIYTLATFDDYATLLTHFRSSGWKQWGCLMAAIALVPLNFGCEAWKWRYQLRSIYPMDMKEAQRQTYFGFVGAFLTPERLGDYPTRVTRIEDQTKWLPAITMGFVGSMALSTVNVLCGLISFTCSRVEFEGVSKEKIALLAYCMMGAFVLLLLGLPRLAAYLDGKRQFAPATEALIRTVKQFSVKEFPVLVGMSFCRYLVYATQLLLVLIFCGIELEMHQFITIIPIHYLFVTLVPTIPLADAAVRGSIGVMIFAWYTSNTAAVAITFIMLWLINTMIPMVVGTMMRTRTKT